MKAYPSFDGVFLCDMIIRYIAKIRRIIILKYLPKSRGNLKIRIQRDIIGEMWFGVEVETGEN